MVKTVVSIHRRGPFSAIVQSESMSYSSIVDRQRENADGSWFGVQARNPTADGLTADTSMYFVWGSKSYCVTRLYPYFSLGTSLIYT